MHQNHKIVSFISFR